MRITIENLQLRYGDVTAVHDLDLEIGDGESVALLGRSGCGKTSTMRCIAGLEEPTAGRITIGDTVVFDAEAGINVPPNKRNVGMVFQSYAVWPHMTVFDNVAYSLKLQKVPKAEIRQRVLRTLELVGLESLANRGASLLSGGQMQRVALARSLVMRPSVLLLDEPLSNLDARLRDRLRVELREIQLRLGLTAVYVTHDQLEAFSLADRIALMQDGRIVQMDRPDAMYHSPVSASVAHFLGVANVFDVVGTEAGRWNITGTDLAIASTSEPGLGEGGLKACVRSEDVQLSAERPSGPNAYPATVLVSGFQGTSTRYTVSIAGTLELDVVTSARSGTRFANGERVWVSIAPDAVRVLPEKAVSPAVSGDTAIRERVAS
ncbi:ABC transporter ATP-binding protein [Saccharomonospora glauca]|uniref:ABC-type spermidine/putrescine transport system, ATPase component n=1 Tax=Saccharomonospora glauca K62 TaxID=928724 RepID=I1D2V9_9PSEU|nr:ABC transporter ATP-binding protein [Saccharomonospora glauca]EIE99283.1 ABC-type spermidine/putrescine transport system, ATPase component [Saccharomonospora glauca K62]